MSKLMAVRACVRSAAQHSLMSSAERVLKKERHERLDDCEGVRKQRKQRSVARRHAGEREEIEIPPGIDQEQERRPVARRRARREASPGGTPASEKRSKIPPGIDQEMRK